MSENVPSNDELAGLVEQLARRLHSQCYAANLFPAQWSALRYIQGAEADLRTAIDLARFQGLASGAVARTVRTLIAKGYLEKSGRIGRGRAERLSLTEKGRQILKKDPLATLAGALDDLDMGERRQLASALERVIGLTRPGEAMPARADS